MKNRKISTGLKTICMSAVAVGISAVVLWALPSSAATVTDNTVQSYEAKIADLENQQKAAEAKIQETKNKTGQAMERKRAIDESIGLTARKISTAESMVSELKAQVEEKEELIAETEESMKEQREAFLSRMVDLQLGGNATYLDLIFGSEDLSSFLTHMDYVSSILTRDKTIIAELNESKRIINDAKSEIEASLVRQEEVLTQLESDRNYYNSLSIESEKTLDDLKKDQALYEAEYKNAAAAEAALNEELSSYLAELQKKTNKAYVGGDFMWPLDAGSSRISSHYGGRTLNGAYEWHPATDISAPAGTPIYAANSGEVLRSELHSSYGNYVLIDHGDGKATLYAHMTTRAVSAGQTVSRGEVIGFVGTTGYSFGNHLHFEMRVNGERVDAEQYVQSPY